MLVSPESINHTGDYFKWLILLLELFLITLSVYKITGLVASTIMIILCIASIYDIRRGIIPNALILFGAGAACVMMSADVISWYTSLFAAATIVLILDVIRMISSIVYSKPALGMGDIKLFAILGLFLGWEVLWILYLTILSAGIFSGFGLITGRLNRAAKLPLAPFVAVGTLTGWIIMPWQFIYRWLL